MKNENNGRMHCPGISREAIAKCLYDYMKKAREKVGNNSTYVDVTVSNNCHNSGRVRKGGI